MSHLPEKPDDCPFVRTRKNDKVRYNPHNATVALTFQLYDDIKLLKALAHYPEQEVGVVKQLHMIRMRVEQEIKRLTGV